MRRIFAVLVTVSFLVLFTQSCTIKLNGASTTGLKTINVGYFENNAPLVVNYLSQQFTEALKDLFQTLNLILGLLEMFLEGGLQSGVVCRRRHLR